MDLNFFKAVGKMSKITFSFAGKRSPQWAVDEKLCCINKSLTKYGLTVTPNYTKDEEEDEGK